MKICLVCIGSPRGPLAASIAEYERRLARYFPYEAIELPAGRGGDPTAVRRIEADAIRGRIPTGYRTFALTRKGTPIDTADLVSKIEDMRSFGPEGSAWVVGGAFGLESGFLETADARVSLSGLTMPHELARLVWTEQMYRVGTILRGEPYHKGRP